jgi:hypothetical protein
VSTVNLSVMRGDETARWHLRAVHNVQEFQRVGSIYGWERRGEVHVQPSASDAEIIGAVLRDVLGRLGQGEAGHD